MKNNISKIGNWKLKISDFRRGMSYVELIVVLSIFSVISSVIIFNYGGFQAKVDIKNLATDIALKIVEAQKSSLSGKFPSLTQQSQITSTWKPSYGLYLNLATDNKSFIYFSDLNNNTLYEGTDCTGECVEKISITKNNNISSINVFYQGDAIPHSFNDLTISFARPSESAIFKSGSSFVSTVSYIQITVLSPKGATAIIKVYPSGRIQVN